AYYGDAPLTGDSASRAAVMSRMAGADVIHLALHSALDEEVPLRSKLLLAASPRESSAAPRAAATSADPPAESALYAYDVYNLKLPQARLVVLSACQTGAERYYGGEGMSSLARPFIAAGVPLVVATLWPVDSDATAELMIRFHGYRARGKLPTAAALARAQTDLIRGPEERLRHPYYWAAFTLVGGHAEF
ncbi:MAG TPA: CHAT domain-containing protein, partial [Pyrinomonadaceae bacterium]